MNRTFLGQPSLKRLICRIDQFDTKVARLGFDPLLQTGSDGGQGDVGGVLHVHSNLDVRYNAV